MSVLARAMSVASLAVTLGCLSAVAMADFTEDFESYPVGDVSGQGPWVGFDGAIETSDVSTARAFSGTQSLALSLSAATPDVVGSDVFIANLNGAPVTSGVWTLSYQLYIPSSFDGQVIMYVVQGTLPDQAGFVEGAFMRANNNAGINPSINRLSFVGGQNGTTPAVLVLDEWVEISAVIDLDNDTLELSYNGSVFHTETENTPDGNWNRGAAAAAAIGGINIWVTQGTNPGTVFLDDFSFTSDSTVDSIGDFNDDGVVNCDDLDGYVGNIDAAVTPATAPLDLDGDLVITAGDANTHITTLVQTSNGVVGTFPGDVNCDGQVNVLGDAFVVVANLGSMNATSYSQGDLNFDGLINILGDAFILVANLGNSNQ